MKKIKIISAAVVLIVIVSIYSYFFQGKDMVLAVASDNLSGFAWSDNIGWVSFNSSDCDADNNGISDGTPAGCPLAGTSIPNYGVNVGIGGAMSGFAWSDNIGWIDFGPSGSYPELPNNGGTLDRSTGLVSGWARALAGSSAESGGWDGWIKLGNDSNGDGAYDNGSDINLINDYGAMAGLFNAGSCEWGGYSWGGGGDTGVVGWISFSGTASDGSLYGVKGTGRPACAEGNFRPVAEAGISATGISGSYSANISTTTGNTIIFISADKDLNGDGKVSRDPNGWNDTDFGVKSGGNCEWFKNDGVATTSINKKNNPRNPATGDCNLTLASEIFSSTGRYDYSLVITDKPGLKSATSTVSVNVTAAVSPTLVIEPSSFGLIVGGTKQFEAWYDSDGVGPLVRSKVTNSAVWSTVRTEITVSATGNVTAISTTLSPAIITADYSGLSANASVNVTAAPLPLAATCSGVASGMSITWTAAPSGGVAPYTYSWLDDASGSGNPITNTYSPPAGTKNARVTVTDNISSSVTSPICSATTISAPINGACGTTGTVMSMPLPGDLCSAGTPSPASLSGSSPWTWSCVGLNGGADASCRADLVGGGGGGGSSSSVGWDWIWRPR